MATPALLALPDDAARALVGFLDTLNLQNVASTTRAASRGSYFQRLRDAKPATLTLPPTNEADRCRQLIQGIHRRNPQRLASLHWIQVTTPCQAELLAEDPAIAQHVRSVRVRATDPKDSAVVGQICATLCALPGLLKLDVASTPLERTHDIALLTQLQELDLSGTNITDLLALVTLTELRTLVLENSLVFDIGCIRAMPRPEQLRVSQNKDRKRQARRRGDDIEPTVVPSFQGFSELHTLVLRNCSVESTVDLIHVAPTLRHLELKNVSARNPTWVSEDAWPPRDVHEDELLARLEQLETIRLRNAGVIVGDSPALAKIPSLRAIKHFVEKDLRALETLVNLEEINLCLPEGDNPNFIRDESEDYTFLLRLPRLKKITIEQTTELPRHWMPDFEEIHDEHVRRHATTLAEVLPKLPNLTSLDYTGFIPNDEFLPSLKHLRHIGLVSCEPVIRSFDWIRGFHSLRSLDLNLPTSFCDLAAVGTLSALESLRLVEHPYVRDAAARGYHRFLSHLVNLKKLELSGYVEDLELLREMKKLETLEIRSTRVLPNIDALRSLVSLRVINVAKTKLQDISPLAALPRLCQASIPAEADCRPLVAVDGPPNLVRVLHPERDCLPQCHHRQVLMRRELESQNAIHDSDEDKGGVILGGRAADY